MEYKEVSLTALGEAISTSDFKLGEVVGLEKAATLLLDMSKTAFAEGKDERAFELRELSRTLKEQAKLSRTENEHYSVARRNAFAELTRRDELTIQQ